MMVSRVLTLSGEHAPFPILRRDCCQIDGFSLLLEIKPNSLQQWKSLLQIIEHSVSMPISCFCLSKSNNLLTPKHIIYLWGTQEVFTDSSVADFIVLGVFLVNVFYTDLIKHWQRHMHTQQKSVPPLLHRIYYPHMNPSCIHTTTPCKVQVCE